jgi:hypothetical protein
VSWRQRAIFVRDLDDLRELIAVRHAALDAPAALDRLWAFLALARPVTGRVRDRDGELEAVFETAAGDLGRLLAGADPAREGVRLAQAASETPVRWTGWLPSVLIEAPPQLPRVALDALADRPAALPGWTGLIRLLADAAGDPDVYRATYTAQAVKTPAAAAEIARRLLTAGRVKEAGALLEGAAPSRGLLRAAPEPDFGWETVWIDYLEQSGQGEVAQEVRWASFERTLSIFRARAFISKLADFDDVEAENRAFAHAARFADANAGLRFLMDWPALSEAARMVEARADELGADPDEAEIWAVRLSVRHSPAAHILLRRAAAEALRRRDLATSEHLTKEADGLGVTG